MLCILPCLEGKSYKVELDTSAVMVDGVATGNFMVPCMRKCSTMHHQLLMKKVGFFFITLSLPPFLLFLLQSPVPWKTFNQQLHSTIACPRFRKRSGLIQGGEGLSQFLGVIFLWFPSHSSSQKPLPSSKMYQRLCTRSVVQVAPANARTASQQRNLPPE